MDLETLRKQANKVYLNNFPATTCFERAVFYSWACRLDQCCLYCYMSTVPKEKRTSDRVRSLPSLLAETLLCRELGWDYGFLSGGINVFSEEKLLDLIKKTYEILGEKIWVNIGILNDDQLKKISPYVKGIVGTVEVLDPDLHAHICPDKPLALVEDMFKRSHELGLLNGMTLIVGLGETPADFPLLESFIRRNYITKIHIYGLNPQKGTVFENAEPPTKEEQAEWIARTRLAFPTIDIQCGIWLDRVNRIAYLLASGANSVSKFPATAKFGTPEAYEIENQARLAERKFIGTITRLPDIDWKKKVDQLPFEDDLRSRIYYKLLQYLKKMSILGHTTQ